MVSQEEFSLFLQFNDATFRIAEYAATSYSWFKDFQHQIAELDAVDADALCRRTLQDIIVNQPLVSLYQEVDSFQTENIGTGWLQFGARPPFVEKTVKLLKETMNLDQPTSADMEAFIEIVERELEKNSRAIFLKHLLQQNADTAHHHRLQKLEEIVSAMGGPLREASKSAAEFTQVRQALALRYLFNEVLGLTNIDNTRLITLGHLLAAKPIPRDEQTGAWKIANSGLKSAFTKSVRKDGLNYIADLQFVLRVFEPLSGQGAPSIDNAIAALQKDIDREKKKLTREQD